MELYPLKLSFVGKTALWGGDRLKKEYNKACDVTPLSETWELTVREAEQNVVKNGALGGRTLGDVIREYGPGAVSDVWDGKRFPLLIKFIDAADSLSVQVHPTDEYARRVEHDSGKTEMWVVLEAEDGATLIYGQKPGVTQEELVAGLRERRFAEVLCEVPVKKGDVFFIPAGMVHAIGAGIVIAEIQQNSDLTYRVYDFDRRQKDGTLRPLHLAKATDVATVYTEAQIAAQRYSRHAPEEGVLADCRYFRVERLRVSGKAPRVAEKFSFHSVLCLSGGGNILSGGRNYPIVKGDSYFIPAGLGEFTLCGDMTVLDTTL